MKGEERKDKANEIRKNQEKRKKWNRKKEKKNDSYQKGGRWEEVRKG